MTDTTNSIGGTITDAASGMDLQFEGITLGTITSGSHLVTFQANVEFNGSPVPLPPAVQMTEASSFKLSEIYPAVG